MIKIECGDCRCDMNTGDLCFCEDCYKRLEDVIEKLEREVEKLKENIDLLKEAVANPGGLL